MEGTPAQARSPRSEAQSRRHKVQGLRPRRSRHGLLLNRKNFDTFLASRGIDPENATAIAAYLDVGIGTVYAAQRGRSIGDAFVSAVLKKVRHSKQLTLEDLLVEVDAGRAA